MILVKIPAAMHCDEPDCNAQVLVSLALTGMGGFVFKPNGGHEKWQIGLSAPTTPFITRCPKHRREVVEAPILNLPQRVQ